MDGFGGRSIRRAPGRVAREASKRVAREAVGGETLHAVRNERPADRSRERDEKLLFVHPLRSLGRAGRCVARRPRAARRRRSICRLPDRKSATVPQRKWRRYQAGEVDGATASINLQVGRLAGPAASTWMPMAPQSLASRLSMTLAPGASGKAIRMTGRLKLAEQCASPRRKAPPAAGRSDVASP